MQVIQCAVFIKRVT